MSTMEDRDTAMTRDPAHTPGMHQGYAPQYGRPYYGRNLWTETRPSFLTSEFLFRALRLVVDRR